MRRIPILVLAAASFAQQRGPQPQPPAVVPGESGRAPSDAVRLFDGSSVEGWTRRDGSATGCIARDSELVCRSGSGDAVSKERFGSAQIHVEFNLPDMPNQKGQLRGNSGVYVQGRYEIQVLDSLNNPTYPNGSAGAVYGQHVPLVNPSAGPGKWQTYDILFRAPKCADGRVTEPGRITLLFNGVLVQNHVPVDKASGGAISTDVCAAGSLLLQDHSGFKDAPLTELRFRNVWIRRLAD